jgi:hypothetical protein
MEPNSIGLRSDFISQIREKIANNTLTANDMYYNMSSLEILENSAGFEAQALKLIADVSVGIEQKLALFDSKINDLSLLDTQTLMLPPIYNHDHSANWFKQLDSNILLFADTNNKSEYFNLWHSTNRGKSWEQLIEWNTDAIDTKYRQNYSEGFDIIKDGDNYRLFWYRANIIYTGLITSGFLTNIEAISGSATKYESIKAVSNSRGDIAVFFTQTESSYYTPFYITRVDGVWKEQVQIISNTVTKAHDKTTYHQALCINDKFYGLFDNASNRMVLTQLEYNDVSGEYDFTNLVTTVVNAKASMYYAKIDTDDYIYIFTSNTVAKRVNVTNTLGQLEEISNTSTWGKADTTTAVLDDGTMISNKSYTKDGIKFGAISHPVHRAVYMFGGFDIIPCVHTTPDDMQNVYLFDFKSYFQNKKFKGVSI